MEEESLWADVMIRNTVTLANTGHLDILTVRRVLESYIYNVLNVKAVSWMNASKSECLFRSSCRWSPFPCWPPLKDSSS